MKDVAASDLSLKRFHWYDLFDDEAELIGAMMKCKSDEKKYPWYQLVRGYMYIESFKKQYKKDKMLTEKQMIQLKRLAKSIYAHLKGY